MDDAEGIAGVQIRGWQTAYRGLLPDELLDSFVIDESARQRRERLEAAPAGERSLVADDEGRVVGWVMSGPSRDTDQDGSFGEVYAIYVDPDVTSRGIGAALLDRALEILRTDGFAHASLWVLRNNARARAFYEREGWRPDGAEKVESLRGFELDEVRYRRTIP